jgi:hypothetical protein
VGLYDSYREVIGMALLHDGVHNVNTRDAVALAEASGALEALARIARVALTTEGAYEGLPNGTFALHQTWSGDILSALRWGRAEALGDGAIPPVLLAERRGGGGWLRPRRHLRGCEEPGARVPESPARAGCGLTELRLERLPTADRRCDPPGAVRIAIPLATKDPEQSS